MMLLRPKLAVLALPLLSACASSSQPSDLMLATLYVNAAGEYDATCRSIYAAATKSLEEMVASREQAARTGAVVLDVDETVLDNSPYEVRLIEGGTSYPKGWDGWCNEAAAELVPGVEGFIARARALGVEVFFVTNRKEHLEEGTRRNLAMHGLLEKRDFDNVLMRGEIPEWTRDKTSRREHVEKSHEILILVGDNLGDFYAFEQEEPTNASRSASVVGRAAEWGISWFMLPNPMYGGWDEAAVGYDYKAPPAAQRELRMGELDAKR